MAFWDELKKRTTQLFNLTAEKTTEIVDISKLKLEASSCSSDIKKLYEKLGTVVYQQHKDENEDKESLDSICAEIAAKLSHLEELNAAINAKKTGTVCPVCNETNPSDAKFCQKCGSKLG